MGWKYCKHPLSHREFSRFNGSPLRKGSFTSLVFIWPYSCRAHSVGKALSSRCLLKWISSNCLAWQLFNITAAGANNTSTGAKKSVQKHIKGKFGEWDVQRGCEKFQHISIDQKVHTQVYGWEHAQVRSEKTRSSVEVEAV